MDSLCVIREREVRGGRLDCSEMFKDRVLRAPIVEVCGCYLTSFAFTIELLNRDDAFGVFIRQTTQQNAVDDAEDGGAGADAQGESYHHNRGESGMLHQPPQTVSNVFDYRIHIP